MRTKAYARIRSRYQFWSLRKQRTRRDAPCASVVRLWLVPLPGTWKAILTVQTPDHTGVVTTADITITA